MERHIWPPVQDVKQISGAACPWSRRLCRDPDSGVNPAASRAKVTDGAVSIGSRRHAGGEGCGTIPVRLRLAPDRGGNRPEAAGGTGRTAPPPGARLPVRSAPVANRRKVSPGLAHRIRFGRNPDACFGIRLPSGANKNAVFPFCSQQVRLPGLPAMAESLSGARAAEWISGPGPGRPLGTPDLALPPPGPEQRGHRNTRDTR